MRTTETSLVLPPPLQTGWPASLGQSIHQSRSLSFHDIFEMETQKQQPRPVFFFFRLAQGYCAQESPCQLGRHFEGAHETEKNLGCYRSPPYEITGGRVSRWIHQTRSRGGAKTRLRLFVSSCKTLSTITRQGVGRLLTPTITLGKGWFLYQTALFLLLPTLYPCFA